MKGELPELPFGHFHQVNFFGRPLSNKYGPIYYIWHCFTPVVWVSYWDNGSVLKAFPSLIIHMNLDIDSWLILLGQHT